MSNSSNAEKTATADPFRDFAPPVAPGPKRGNANMIDLVAATSTMRFWSMKTPHALADVLKPVYFQNLVDVRLRAEDRIEIICDCYSRQPIHALLVVDTADKHGHVTVKLLTRYERQ